VTNPPSPPSISTVAIQSGPRARTEAAFAGFGSCRWIPFLDRWRDARVIVPSLPGFPGGDKAHTVIDSHLDWIVAMRSIFVQAGLEGAELVGSSLGGALAAEIAALWPQAVRRLVLIAPFGIYREDDPTESLFAQRPDDVQMPAPIRDLQLKKNDRRRSVSGRWSRPGPTKPRRGVAARRYAARARLPLLHPGAAAVGRRGSVIEGRRLLRS
jgi:pimeloyl-ACP methyl ester carboxylesterase